MITVFGSGVLSWIFLQALTDVLMQRRRSRCANCSMDLGESILRITSLQDILRPSCGIQFGLLAMSGALKELHRISGFIWLLRHLLKFLRLLLDGG
jgi:hypothetical protein